MLLFFAFLTLSMISLNGMQLSDNKDNHNEPLIFRNAVELMNSGKSLVVYYNEAEKLTKDYSIDVINDFRNVQSTSEHIVDYVVNGALQFESKPKKKWLDMPKSIEAILSTKRGAGYYRCGFVVYTTQSNESYAFNRYMNDLQLLQKAYVPVIVFTHNKQIAEKIFYQSSINSSHKSLVVNGSLVHQDNWLKNFLWLSVIGITGVLLGKFIVSSN